MEVAWNDNNQTTGTEGAEFLMELDEIMTATNPTVTGATSIPAMATLQLWQ